MSGEFVVPPAFEPGDRVAVVAPSSGRHRETFHSPVVDFSTERAEGRRLVHASGERVGERRAAVATVSWRAFMGVRVVVES